MRRKLTASLILAFAFCASLNAADRKVVRMGTEMVQDSSKHSPRILSNRLVAVKGQWAAGFSMTNVSLSADDADFMLLLKDASADISARRFAFSGLYCYAPNEAIGIKVGFGNYDGLFSSATLDLLNEGLSFDAPQGDFGINNFSVKVFHRNWYGLDRDGRVALLCDFSIGYKRSFSARENERVGGSSRLFVTFSPGVEIWMMDFVSLRAGIPLASVSGKWSENISKGTHTGFSDIFKAKAGIDPIDIDFGITVYF